MYRLETNQLTHSFSAKENMLHNINLQVPEGSIYGFLGPNGAGKTTTLRLVLGLLKKQKGEILFLGKPFQKNRTEILKKVGSLIESPSLYSHLTAVENLRVLQTIYQCPKENMDHVLQLTGLSHTGKKKVGQFSLGMKQRLSIAVALLHNPSLLILDEPTNGLDPNGIIEMRTLLKSLNAEKKITILISSHLLSEIEKLVTHVGIIHKGNMMFQGTLSQLTGMQQTSSHIKVHTSNTEASVKLINDYGIDCKVSNGKITLPLIAQEKMAAINRSLVLQNVEVYEITVVHNDLETIFINLVNN